MRSFLPGILVALLIGGVSSCSRPTRQPTEKSSLEPILGAVDVPARDGILKRGSVSVGGWAVAKITYSVLRFMLINSLLATEQWA